MSGFAPEKLTAYQRWEVAAFDEAEQAAKRAAEAAAQALADAPAETVETTPQVVLPTADDIERMHIEAHEQGYAAGHSEGYAAGLAAGHDEGLAGARASVAKIDALMTSLQQSLDSIDQQVANRLLATAVEIASQMLRQSLRVKPELLLPVVREAVATLYPHGGHPTLFAHPDDAALIRTHLGEQLAHSNWRIIDDASLSTGGCRVEVGASEVDATLETRWRRVIDAIGISPEWLSEKPWNRPSHE
jgi:flagellar assembly protein FliH